MNWFLTLVELIGTVAFAISGAATAIRKGMDVFGVCILGIITAVGGGIVRDLVIGVTPPHCFQDPLYFVVACLSALGFFLLHRVLEKRQKAFDWVLFAMDTVGLAVFTVLGIQAAERAGDFGSVLLVCVGMLTGTGGGVMRDLMAGNTPYIFVKHVYATASMAGAVLYLLLRSWAPYYAATLAAMALIVVIRCLSAHYRWNLPRSRA